METSSHATPDATIALSPNNTCGSVRTPGAIPMKQVLNSPTNMAFMILREMSGNTARIGTMQTTPERLQMEAPGKHLRDIIG